MKIKRKHQENKYKMSEVTEIRDKIYNLIVNDTLTQLEIDAVAAMLYIARRDYSTETQKDCYNNMLSEIVHRLFKPNSSLDVNTMKQVYNFLYMSKNIKKTH